jgi:hypothetical protein
MEHLNAESLARLIDEAPSEEERVHLDACGDCAGELEALREQTLALGGLADLRPPRGAWDTLEARLVSEGLVRRGARFGWIGTTPPWMRVAASALLFAVGTGLGLVLAQGPLGTLGMPGIGRDSALGSPFQLASDASSVEDAAEVVRLAERQYMDALIRYRQLLDAQNGDADIGEPGARYAALEYLVAATQVAVEQAPADPFLNGLLASALAERQTARQEWVRRTGSGEDWY